MWYIAGTLPRPDPVFHQAAAQGPAHVCDGWLHLADGSAFPVQRGTAALAAAALLTCETLAFQPPRLLLAGDTGSGEGSRALYAWLTDHAHELNPDGMTFHYLFPDADWHNRVLMALQALPAPPVLVADAGFMYVAKMSGYADAYDLFTPDLGEMAFLADEKAPHPFYTRGFLLAEEENVPALLERANAHGNCPANLIIKGRIDYIVCGGRLTGTVKEPSAAAMECIGGTGDLVTGLVTALLAGGISICRASLAAARLARLLAAHCAPNPGTQVSELLQNLPQVLRNYGEEVLRRS